MKHRENQGGLMLAYNLQLEDERAGWSLPWTSFEEPLF